ncbi:MAG: prolipoprotein diacylglyceryl transferase [Planctomycetota bacterium]
MTVPAWAALLYPLMMMAALFTAMWLKERQPVDPRLTPIHRLWIALGAFVGAMITAKLPFLIFDPHSLRGSSEFLISGKTILFGMVGGYLGVELVKWRLGLKVKTGDSFAIPVAGSIAVGRLSCFVGSCCYGQPTTMPWGVVFAAVDQQPRHPTQIYEALFHVFAAIVLVQMHSRGMFREQLIKLYFISYGVYRFFSEFLRPEDRIVAGLTVYQIGSILLIITFAALWHCDARKMRSILK